MAVRPPALCALRCGMRSNGQAEAPEAAVMRSALVPSYRSAQRLERSGQLGREPFAATARVRLLEVLACGRTTHALARIHRRCAVHSLNCLLGAQSPRQIL